MSYDNIPKGIMTCYIVWRGLKFPLTKVKMKYMTKIMDNTVGFPQVFDCRGRVWPLPDKDLKIVKE